MVLWSPWAALVLALVSVGGVLAGSGVALAPTELSGRVTDARGTPVPGATVRLLQQGSVVGGGTTGATGGFHVSGGLRVRVTDLEIVAPDFLPLRTAKAAVVLHHRPTVQGRAVDDTGAGLPYALVAVELAGGDTIESMTDSDGFFAFDRGLLPGPALLSVVKPGHDAYEALVALGADQVEQVGATMARQLAWIDVTTDPAGFAVVLDGQPVAGCERTPCTAAVTPGDHTVSIDDPLYEPWSVPVSLFEHTHAALGATLTRKTGTLVVAAPGGTDAVLTVDGQPEPATGWKATLPTGTHTIAFTSADRWPWSAEVEVKWNQEADVTVAAPLIDAGSDQAFLANMSAYLDSLPGHYSVYLGDLSGGHVLAYHASDGMEAASVIKLPLAIYIEQQAQAGALKMDDQVELQDGDFMGGTGTLQSTNAAGDKISYHDLLALLIQQSDNTAWQALDRVLGSDKVDAYAASIGAPDCHQSDDQCTAQEAGLLAGRLASGSLLDSDHTRDLLNLLETTAFNDRINYYLGGLTIAHKVGMDGGVMNDTGVVFGGRPFVISVFTDSDDPNQGIEVIRLVARAAAKIYTR